MPDLLDGANRWLTDMTLRHRTRTVTYVRGEVSAPVLATVGRSVFRIDAGHGIFEHVEVQDYLVAVENMVDADLGEPQAGDQVLDAFDGQVETFEVMAPGGEPHFKMDPYRRMYRIHTKRVGEP